MANSVRSHMGFSSSYYKLFLRTFYRLDLLVFSSILALCSDTCNLSREYHVCLVQVCVCAHGTHKQDMVFFYYFAIILFYCLPPQAGGIIRFFSILKCDCMVCAPSNMKHNIMELMELIWLLVEARSNKCTTQYHSHRGNKRWQWQRFTMKIR